LKKYLEKSKNCQVTNKIIKLLSKKLGSSKTDLEKAKTIFNWVRDKISYSKYRNTKKGALSTLLTRNGNCVDQAHLSVALYRSSGIPARYVNGLNCKFNSGYTSGHVWAEVYVDGKWISSDTTSSKNSLGSIKNWNTKSFTLAGKYSSINF